MWIVVSPWQMGLYVQLHYICQMNRDNLLKQILWALFTVIVCTVAVKCEYSKNQKDIATQNAASVHLSDAFGLAEPSTFLIHHSVQHFAMRKKSNKQELWIIGKKYLCKLYKCFRVTSRCVGKPCMRVTCLQHQYKAIRKSGLTSIT